MGQGLGSASSVVADLTLSEEWMGVGGWEKVERTE